MGPWQTALAINLAVLLTIYRTEPMQDNSELILNYISPPLTILCFNYFALLFPAFFLCFSLHNVAYHETKLNGYVLLFFCPRRDGGRETYLWAPRM